MEALEGVPPSRSLQVKRVPFETDKFHAQYLGEVDDFGNFVAESTQQAVEISQSLKQKVSQFPNALKSEGTSSAKFSFLL